MDTAWQQFAKQQAQQRRDLFRRISGTEQIARSSLPRMERTVKVLEPSGLAGLANKWASMGAISPTGDRPTYV